MTKSWWWLVVDGLAVYRLTVLVVKDKITAPAREQLAAWAYNPDCTVRRPAGHWLHELITCVWCVSIWLAVGVVALTAWAPRPWSYAAAVLALSAVAGLLGDR